MKNKGTGVKSLFKWVHLSDMHFCPKKIEGSSFNSTELRAKLPSYLPSVASNVNALIISGDYRYAPSKEENPQNVAEYIIDLAKSINLDSSRIYLVPGNHDLDRDVIRNDIINGLRGEYKPEEGTFDTVRLKALESGFTFFNKLYNTVCKTPLPIPENNPHYTVPLENCNLLFLNTALAAGMEKDQKADDAHNLILGSGYLSAAVHNIDNNKPTIAIGHHGMEYLREDEYKVCAKFLDEAGIRLYLCGHTHQLWNSSFGNCGKEITVGCMMQTDQTVDAGFSVGELFSDGTVMLKCYKWDVKQQNWYPHPPGNESYKNLYSIPDEMLSGNESDTSDEVNTEEPVQQKENLFSLKGYVLLGGRGIDGIKYIWEKDGLYLESLAFNRRLKDSLDLGIYRVSAYTCSVSYGCRLSFNNQQCRFCETGKAKYYGDARAEDIALQNIFMATYDSDCPSFPDVRGNEREFAFMGQGEPGFCYPAVRRAIQLTDYAMNKINQRVSRYIISTCGICDFIPILISDIKSGLFKNRITVHFSLHAIDDDRTTIMPVNREHDYKRFIKECEKFYSATGEKIGVGILLFNKYQFADESERPYTLTVKRLDNILQVLDKNIFRIDLCDVNRTSCGKQPALSNENANRLLEIVKRKGFEGKLFSSFGDNEESGCGMLACSVNNISLPGNKTNKHFNSAVDLLNEAIASLDS